MSDNREDIDWSLTTWEGSRRAQLRYALTLTLRERMEAVEGMGDVVRRFDQMRREGAFRSGAHRTEPVEGTRSPGGRGPG